MFFAALEEDQYYLVGLFLAYAVVHKGPLPKFLHPALYEVLATGEISDSPIEDIPEEDVREKVTAVIIIYSLPNYMKTRFRG